MKKVATIKYISDVFRGSYKGPVAWNRYELMKVFKFFTKSSLNVLSHNAVLSSFVTKVYDHICEEMLRDVT